MLYKFLFTVYLNIYLKENSSLLIFFFILILSLYFFLNNFTDTIKNHLTIKKYVEYFLQNRRFDAFKNVFAFFTAFRLFNIQTKVFSKIFKRKIASKFYSLS